MHFRCPKYRRRFKSLADLCALIFALRRALEALIHCGAFDNIESNRNQLLTTRLVIDWAQSALRIESLDRSIYLIVGMSEGTGASNGFESAPKAPL